MTRTGRWCAAGVLAVLGFWLLARPSFEGDSQVLIQNAFDLRACLLEGRLSGCAEGGQFPLFQVIPAFILSLAGFGIGAVAHFLAYLSFGCSVSWYFIFKAGLKNRAPALLPAALLVLTSGFGLRYIDSTFGEPLAATLVLGMVGSALAGAAPPLTAALFAGAVITKDTAFPFAAFDLALALWLRGQKNEMARARELAWLAIGGALGVGADAAFNFFRFSSPLNLAYLRPEYFVHDPGIQRSFFAALWFSPNGGLAFFWTSFVCVALAATWVARPRIPVACIWLPLLGLTLGFSKWFAPLGWYAWGPRLLLPWLPAALLLFLYAAGPGLERALGRLSGWRSWCLSIGLAATAFPHARVLLRYQWVNRLIEAPICSAGANPLACMSQKLWPSPFPIWGIYSWQPERLEFVGALLLVAIWFAAVRKYLDQMKGNLQ